jgi:hypothetical protein
LSDRCTRFVIKRWIEPDEIADFDALYALYLERFRRVNRGFGSWVSSD